MEMFKIIIDYSPAVVSIEEGLEGWNTVFTSDNISQFGYTPEDVYNTPNITKKMVHPDGMDQANAFFEHAIESKKLKCETEYRLITKDGRIRCVLDTSQIIWDENSVVDYTITIQLDVTRQKEAEFEKERLINELQATLDEVQALQGLIPICANCKNVRDDKGYWGQLEVYFSSHSNVEFSHAFCPDCLNKLYPEDTDQ